MRQRLLQIDRLAFQLAIVNFLHFSGRIRGFNQRNTCHGSPLPSNMRPYNVE